MSETNDRIESLEREVRRLRTGLLILAVALVAAFALGATQGTPDELKLRRLAIVDADGKDRVVASTFPDGSASIEFYDQDAKGRIIAGTVADGRAIIGIYDGKEKSVWGEVSFK